MRVIGIDPGLRCTGWGVIEMAGNRLSHVATGRARRGGNHSLTGWPISMICWKMCLTRTALRRPQWSRHL